MLHEERVDYKTLKSWALAAYYDGCRDYAIAKGLPHSHVMGYVLYAFEDGFERPLENLMWEVINYILCGGWFQEGGEILYKRIKEAIESDGIEGVVSELAGEEREDFLRDLRSINFEIG
ncbi:hypothetical protein [Xanthomonas euvesicatoria]|uniref:Uncharacterized protein n=1 Tax=Xanthomonas euvesicatoria TaxID=456327 RepID=A0AAW3U257_XANEU|nr:hypothetical protein [Xanthomonas euvesicatoria]MBB4723183.1 hypothetical protein [Xanthomonas euvesicatoria]MBB4870305.1 hypothetical protein [Xanthomonas euvesicatoria]